MELSIVTGTYNRIASLQRMVESARDSLHDFHSYEIVVVDGGSTDETIEWCKQQKDIKLVEQGALFGAVNAFNTGAERSNGNYVILANDDITFIDYSILYAVSYMRNNAGCGMGCFYQDRDGRDFHVSRMKGMLANGVMVSVYYGQVCIVPRWLGDELGWWGDYLHTYGGDNELSCHIWEAGYTVDAIECACISDGQIDDDLRKINNPSDVMTGRHPDTMKWATKWPNGPQIPSERRIRELDDIYSVMYLPLFEPGNKLQPHTKVGLRNALQHNFGSVLQVDYMANRLEDIFAMAEAYEPDIFMFQLQDANRITAQLMSTLRIHHPTARFINWNGDYHPENLFSQPYIQLMQQFDLCGFVTTQMADVYNDNHVNWFYWQIGYEDSDAEPDEDTPKHDIVFLGNGYNERRRALGRFLVGLREKGWDIGIYGSWSDFKPNGANLYDFDQGQKLYRNAKFAISSQQYQEATGFVSNRLFQAMAAGGCVVLQQRFPGMEILGLEDGVHYAVWDDFEHLEDLLWELDDPVITDGIATRGTAYVREHYSFDAQVKKLLVKMKECHLL